MIVVSTTDHKYIGTEILGDFQVGDLITLGDFSFEITFSRTLENGHLTIGSPNYQIELED